MVVQEHKKKVRVKWKNPSDYKQITKLHTTSEYIVLILSKNGDGSANINLWVSDAFIKKINQKLFEVLH